MNIVLYNGNIVTMDTNMPGASAMVLSGGTITSIGSDDDILRGPVSSDLKIDLRGRLVLPGFHDSHMHLLNFGYVLTQARLQGCGSASEMVERGRTYISDNSVPDGTWILGRGWNQDTFSDGRLPDRKDLDAISTMHPILFARACGHIAVLNTRALKEAGIFDSPPPLKGGAVDTGSDGVPTGIVREGGVDYVRRCIPNPSGGELKEMILRAQGYALRAGITSVGSDDFSALPQYDPDLVIRVFEELEQDGTLKLRVNEQCWIHDAGYVTKFLSNHTAQRGKTGTFTLGPLKLLADGSLGARTALLKDAYHDDPGNYGIAVFSQEYLDKLIGTAHRNDMPAAVHCIGDEALAMVLTSFERAFKKWGRKALRHGIVHCQISERKDLESMRELALCAYVQPIFIDYDHRIVERRVGEGKARTSYNFKTLKDMGVHVAGGSDCPVEPCDVLPNIYCAVTRKGLDGLPEGGFLPDERMSVYEAVELFTTEGGYVTGQECFRGRIREGMSADLVVLDRDIFSISPEEIKDTKVFITIIDGEIVYRESDR